MGLDIILPPRDAISMNTNAVTHRVWCAYGSLNDGTSLGGGGLHFLNGVMSYEASSGWTLATIVHLI